MLDQTTLGAIDTGDLILQVDAARPAADPFKLPAPILALVTSRLGDAKAKNAAATMMGSATIGAAAQRQRALDRLADLLRNGYKGIGAIPSEDLPDAQRVQVYAAYGWTGGLLGDLESPDRIKKLAGLASTATVSVVGITPLTPGVTYQLWVGGENSRGQGAASPKVNFTA